MCIWNEIIFIIFLWEDNIISKNNQNEFLRKMQAQRQHYGLRKLSIGVASVLLDATILMGGGYK